MSSHIRQTNGNVIVTYQCDHCQQKTSTDLSDFEPMVVGIDASRHTVYEQWCQPCARAFAFNGNPKRAADHEACPYRCTQHGRACVIAWPHSGLHECAACLTHTETSIQR